MVSAEDIAPDEVPAPAGAVVEVGVAPVGVGEAEVVVALGVPAEPEEPAVGGWLPFCLVVIFLYVRGVQSASFDALADGLSLGLGGSSSLQPERAVSIIQ